MLIKNKIKSTRVETERLRRLMMTECRSNQIEFALLRYDIVRDYLRRILEEFTKSNIFISHTIDTALQDIPDKTDIPTTGYSWNTVGSNFTDIQKLAYLHVNTGTLSTAIGKLDKDIEAYVNSIQPVLPELKIYVEQARLNALEIQALIYSELNRLKDANL